MKKGISNFNVRIENRKKLTEMLYWGNGMSKQDIAINMELSMPTVNLLVSQLEEEGRKRGIKTFFLEVRKSNAPAIHLYESCGFAAQGIRKNFYENPREDGILMCKR